MNAKPDNPGPGLAVARCLRGLPDFAGRLIGLGYDALDPGLHHGLLDAAYLLPYPTSGADAQFERLTGVRENERIDVVIPCLDAELTNFAHNETRLLSLGMRTLAPTREQIKGRAKDNLPALCRRLSIAVPDTRPVTDPSFFDRCTDDGWTYPLVVKGIYYDAAIVHDPAEAKAAFHRIADQWGYPVLAQEFVPGYEVNLVAVGDGRGGMVSPVMMRKKALTEKGKAWAGIAIDDDDLERLASRIVRALNWRGPLEVEALRGDDGLLYLIEVNPRFPAWVYLSHGVGRNLPAMVLRLLAGETAFDPPPPRPGTLFIRYAEEVIVPLGQFEAILIDGAVRTGSGNRKDP
ncbi:MAG: ATP-grasp domain-containing protein [Alphaproteobacteria bacterium]|nr:ATP-grasp domain-containing protein [Alphaproteobacteria bacterium]